MVERKRVITTTAELDALPDYVSDEVVHKPTTPVLDIILLWTPEDGM